MPLEWLGSLELRGALKAPLERKWLLEQQLVAVPSGSGNRSLVSRFSQSLPLVYLQHSV